MDHSLFFAIFNFFNATHLGALFAIFFASWLVVILAAFLFFYEWYVQRGEGFASVLRSSVVVLFPATIALFFSELVKIATPSPRPFLVFDIEPLISVSAGMGSFPSTHATFISALALTAYLRDHRLGKWYLAGMALVGVGRIAVGVHFPTDVFTGIIFGFIVSFFIFRVETSFKK